MAEAYFRHLMGNAEVVVSSAGTSAWPGAPPSKNSLAVLAAQSIDATGLRSSQFSDAQLSADRIYTMTRSHRDMLVGAYPELADRVKTLLSLVGSNADVIDPFGGDLAEYQACFANIRPALDALARELADG